MSFRVHKFSFVGAGDAYPATSQIVSVPGLKAGDQLISGYLSPNPQPGHVLSNAIGAFEVRVSTDDQLLQNGDDHSSYTVTIYVLRFHR